MGLYTRHGGQGGKFNRGEFGDLGLRAYADARNREIKVAEEQRQQEQAYSQQHLQQIEGSGAKQIQHNRMLQQLEQDVGQLAIDNTKLRGKREVEEILGRADEAKKESEFWKDFSTTYSKQYGKAAGELYDFATEVQHRRQWEVFRNTPEAQKALEDFGHLNEKGQKNLLIDQYKVFIDKGLPPDQVSLLVSQYTDMGLRMNHKTKMALANLILKKWPAQAALIQKEAEDGKVQWTNENIRNLYALRGHELLKEFGISPTSMAGRHLLDGIFDKAIDTGKESDDADRAANDHNLAQRYEQVNKGSIGTVKIGKTDKKNVITATGSSFGNFYTGLNQAVIHDATRYRTQKNGAVIKPSFGGKPNLNLSFQNTGISYIKSGYFSSWRQVEDHLLKAPIPSADKNDVKEETVGKETIYTINSKKTWGGKHPANIAVLRKAWKEYEESEGEKATKRAKGEDNTALAEYISRTELSPDNPEYFDTSNIEEIEEAIDLHYGKEKTVKYLRDLVTYNQYDKDSNVVNIHLNSLWKNNQLVNFREYRSHLNPEEKANWKSREDQLLLLHRNGLDEQGLKGYATGLLRQVLKITDKNIDLSQYTQNIDDIQQEFMYQLSVVEDDPANKGKGDSYKLDLVRKALLADAEIGATPPKDGIVGQGIFRRKFSGTSTKFLATLTESEAKATKDEVSAKLKGSQHSNLWEKAFLEIKDNGGKMTVTRDDQSILLPIISIDEADQQLRDISSGKHVEPNETINWLVENQPARGDKPLLSYRQMLNLIFRGLGIQDELPPGTPEWVDYSIKKTTSNTSTKSNTSNTKSSEENITQLDDIRRKQEAEKKDVAFLGIHRYSMANKERCAIYKQCVDLDIVIAGHNAQRESWQKDNELRKYNFYNIS